MVFRIEALPAKHGDCLFLTMREGDERPTRILVDGGPPGVFNTTLKDRLAEEQRAFEDETPLKLDAIMVSHIDQDHIAGVLQLLETMRDAQEESRPVPFKPLWLLHNGFDAILGAGEGTAARDVGGPAALASFGQSGPLALGTDTHPVASAVLQSYGEALRLGSAAAFLQITRNPPDQSLLTGDRAPMSIGGATLRILGPLSDEINNFRTEWHKKVKPDAPGGPAALAAYLDKSVPNLASIIALLEYKGISMLLTGDARGDIIIKACKAAGLLDAAGRLEVDVLKVPHHGSEHDLETGFFQTIRAKHYIISADGKFGNPDRASLDMLEAGTGRRKINVYLTVSAQECDARHAREDRYDPAIHAITPIIERWKAGNRITVSDGAPIALDLP